MRLTTLLCYAFVILLTSCNTLKISSDKKGANIKSIGIVTNFSGNAHNPYKDIIQAAVDEVMNKFNSENHLFSVHKKNNRDSIYISLDFTKIKIANNGEVAAGYIISGLGIFVAPYAIYEISAKEFTLAFWYFPSNRIMCKITLSPYLSSQNSRPQQLSLQTGAMFRNLNKRVSVTKDRLETQLLTMLTGLEKQLK